jgi:hypothetical protein
MQKIRTRFLSVVIILFFSTALSAQKIDTMLAYYADHYQQEKIYIHFDKAIYNKGETIWMKLYLMAGSDFSDYSKNVYVDWFGIDGKLIKHTVAPLFESTAKLQFDIPDNYADPALYAVAYTRWMLNFDSAFLFKKEIAVAQSKPLNTSIANSSRSIHFFPEGGDMVIGIPSRIAFLANDQNGRPVKVKGLVKNASNAVIDSFVSQHDGMGSFTLEPKPNQVYTCYWKDELGETHNTTLPAAMSSGVTLQIQPQQDKALVSIKRSATIGDNLKQLNMVATINQQLFYRSKINLTLKTIAAAEIPTADLPTGIATITLFDANWIPVAERIVFVNNYQHQFYPRVAFPIISTNKRAKNIIEIDVPDTVASNLSVAVTDAGIITDSSSTIISQFLLSSDIKGYVHHPAYYFSSTADSVSKHADLVMLTHGWRRYKWDDITQGKLPAIANPRETEMIMVKGKVFGAAIEKSVIKPSLNLLMSGKDSSRRFLSLPIERDASFGFNNGIFFDTLQLRYMFNGDKKLSEVAEVRFNNGLLPALNLSTNFLLQSASWNNLSDSNTQRRIRMMIEEQERLKKIGANVTLKEVIVRAKTKSPLQVLDEKYTSGMFSSSDSYQFDIVNDLIAQSATSVFNYLQGRVAGLQINMNGAVPSLTWRNSKPDFFLNESPTDVSMLNNIQMTDVAYIKVFRPPFFGAFGGGGGGAIAIYTRKGSEIKSAPSNSSMQKSFVAGYTRYKEFFSPDYTVPQPYNDPDTRTTLYWNPYVFTDPRNHKVRLSFFNNDNSKKLRVIIEGVNADGKLARVEKIIE